MPSIVVGTTLCIDAQVASLLRRWREETAHLSSSSAITGHPAYQELISLSSAALPAIFRDLEQSGDGHLAKALTAITGAHPIAADDRGRVRKVAEVWLGWAREHGFQW